MTSTASEGRSDGSGRAVRPAEAAATAIAVMLAFIATVLLGYFAYAINEVDSIVNESLPCAPSVILDTDPIIDPAGYSLYSNAEVEASEAYDRCLAESLDLLAAEGVEGLSNNVAWLVIVPADVLAGLLLATSWVIALAGPVRRVARAGLSVVTLLSIVAISFQIQHADTVELVGWITN